MNRDRKYIKIVIDRKAALGLLAVALLGVLAATVASQQLSMTATYPIPAGVYNQIVTTGNSGAMAANTTLNRNAGNTILVPPSNSGGRVGIGTASPSALLHVAGATQIDGAASVNGALSAGSLGIAGNSSIGGNETIAGNTSIAGNETVTGDMGGKTVTTTGAGSIGAGLTVANNGLASDWCTTSGKCLSGAVQGPLPPSPGITAVSCPAAWGCSVSGNTLYISPPASVAGACPPGWTCSYDPQSFVNTITARGGGAYVVDYYTGACHNVNPATGNCSCPAGETAGLETVIYQNNAGVWIPFDELLCW